MIKNRLIMLEIVHQSTAWPFSLCLAYFVLNVRAGRPSELPVPFWKRFEIGKLYSARN